MLKHRDFIILAFSEVCASALLELGDGVPTLLDHFLDDPHDVGVCHTGTGVYGGTDQSKGIYPRAGILDVDYGRSAEGDGGHRSSPPVTSFRLRMDVTF